MLAPVAYLLISSVQTRSALTTGAYDLLNPTLDHMPENDSSVGLSRS